MTKSSELALFKILNLSAVVVPVVARSDQSPSSPEPFPVCDPALIWMFVVVAEVDARITPLTSSFWLGVRVPIPKLPPTAFV